MKSRKVLIADPSEEFVSALKAELAPGIQVRCCSRGEQALETADSWGPDLLVLELCTHGLDGLALLRILSRRESRPKVLVISYMLSDFVLAALEDLGVQYAIQKPCPAPRAAEVVQELLVPARSCPGTPAVLMTRMGISETRQGFPYLVTGLSLLVRQRDQRLSKELYEAIAGRYHVSVASVEKAIRDAIRSGWESGDPAVWQEYFPGLRRCPTNKEFLFRMAGQLREFPLCGGGLTA